MTDAPVASGRWRPPFRTIRGLAITFACVTAIVTTLLGMVTFVVVHREIERQIDQRIDIETEALLDYERDHGFDALVEVVAMRDKRTMPGGIGYLASADRHIGREMGYMLIDSTGQRRAGSFAAQLPPPGWSEFVRFRRADGSQGEAQALNSALPTGGRLVVAGDRAMVHSMDRQLMKLFGTAFGLLLLLGSVMVILFGRIIRRRMATIEHAAQAIISGDMSERIPLDGTGVELDRLALLLNRMLDRIGKLVENLRAVSSGLAHDLRTPLSRLIAKLEEAAELSSGAKQQKLLDGALGEIDEMLELFSGLLAVAEIDRQGIRNRFVSLDLASAVVDIVDVLRPAIEDEGKAVEIVAEPVIVRGDRALLQRLVGNLLDNVLKHAPSATRVAVTVGRADGRAVVRVADDGEGIPDSERERVFERLVRLDPSRSRQGHGLGLSIVRAIASAHDGAVKVLPSARGMVVEFRMPLHEGYPA